MVEKTASPAATIKYTSVAGVGRWELRLPAAPVPAARAKITKRGFAYYPKTYAEFRIIAERLLKAATRTGGPWEATRNPVFVWSFFVRDRPAKPANVYPIGDLDNYEKALWDAVTKHAGIAVDDKQYVRNAGLKRYTFGGEAGHIVFVLVEEPDYPTDPEDVYALPAAMRLTYEEAGLL